MLQLCLQFSVVFEILRQSLRVHRTNHMELLNNRIMSHTVIRRITLAGIWRVLILRKLLIVGCFFSVSVVIPCLFNLLNYLVIVTPVTCEQALVQTRGKLCLSAG